MDIVFQFVELIEFWFFFFLKDEFLVPHASLFDSNLLVKKDLLKEKKNPIKR